MKEKEKNLNNNKNTKDKLIINEKLESLNDFELNELDYEEALKQDKRNYMQLYISFQKTKHLRLDDE